MQNKFLFYFRQKEFFRQKDRKVVGTERYKCWKQKDKKRFWLKDTKEGGKNDKKKIEWELYDICEENKMGEIAEQNKRDCRANSAKLVCKSGEIA